MPRGVYNRNKSMADLSESPTDEELGIGVEDDVEAAEAADPIAALLADPRMAAVIEAAVAQRVAQMGLSAGAIPSQPSELAILAKAMERMFELNAVQQPGYQKPLPIEEVERRMAGKVEMEALLVHYRDIGLAPKYTVGEGGFFECVNAQEFVPGSEVRMYLPPPEDFIAENEPALAVMAAQRKWLGVATPHIGDQVEAAMKAAKQAPLIDNAPIGVAKAGLVEITKEAPVQQNKTRRTMGTVVKEPREISLADRAAGPQGPVFTDVAA